MTAFIDAHRDEYGVEPICRVLPIAPSSYRARAVQRSNPKLLSGRAREDQRLKPEVMRVFAECPLPQKRVERRSHQGDWLKTVIP